MSTEEKIVIEVQADSDSIMLKASKKNVFAAIDIPCSDSQCLTDIQNFLEGFEKADKVEED